MMERILRLIRLSRDRHDIDAMSDAELADLGVSRAEALSLAALPDEVPARVTAMARIFGVAEAALLADRGLWHEVLNRCQHCDDLAACHRFMAREAPADKDDVSFCPNRATFEALSAQI